MHQRSFRAALGSLILLISAVSSAGCAAAGAPQINVGEARLVNVTAEAVRFDLTVELTNPNAEPVSLHTIEYRVAIDGAPVYAGRRSAETTLAARGGRLLRLPVVAPREAVAGAAGGAITIAIVGHVEYVTSEGAAAVRRDLGINLPRASFGGQSTLSVEAGALSDTSPR